MCTSLVLWVGKKKTAAPVTGSPEPRLSTSPISVLRGENREGLAAQGNGTVTKEAPLENSPLIDTPGSSKHVDEG